MTAHHDDLRDELRSLATRRNIGRLRKIGHGRKRHPETGALFDALADVLEPLATTEPEAPEPLPLPLHRTEAGYPRCATCDGGGCYDCTDPA